MIKYTKDNIAKLLDKYMDGTSTLEEEDILADYFHHGNVPEASFAEMYPRNGRTIGNSLAR